MTSFLPEFKLLIDGVEYTNKTISNISHQSGRDDIYTQPRGSYLRCEVLALQNENYPIAINNGLTLQVKDSNDNWVNIFGGNITDISVQVERSGSVATTINYAILAVGSLAKLTKIVFDTNLAQNKDGDQIYNLLKDFLLNSWNEVSASQSWSGYNSNTWANAENIGLGEIDQPGQFTMEQRPTEPDYVSNIANRIANSGLGLLYEDSNGNIGYADANHRQTDLANNGYTTISANTALFSGLANTARIADVRNSIVLNYGNNYGSQKTSQDSQSILNYGYKAETINSTIHTAADAQTIADRFVALRSNPRYLFESITFPLNNSELTDAERDALLNIYLGQPIRIIDLPIQINGGEFQGFVENWSWRTSYNELFITIGLSPIEFSLVSVKWEGVSASEYWNTLNNSLTWETAIGAVA